MLLSIISPEFILSLSLPPSLHTLSVPGLVCARHDRNCTALNGCNNVSFCDRHFDSLDLIISPEEESCIVVGGFEDGEFVIQVLMKSYKNKSVD